MVTGQIVHVGRIANYGVSGDASGSLIPVGEGKLQIRDGAANTATALAANAAIDRLEIFVHEGVDKRIDEASEKTLGMWIQNGGVVGLVIIGLGFAGMVLAFLRVLGILRARGGALLPRKIAGLLETGKWGDAFAMVANETNPTERVLSMVLQAGQSDTANLDDTAAEAILAETPAIERYGSAILIVAAVAPLLGLLGTVTGMIGTFDLITEFGTGDPRMLSGGISEALVTTQMGLIVAIPMLLLGNLLNRMGEEVRQARISALTVINRGTSPSVRLGLHGHTFLGLPSLAESRCAFADSVRHMERRRLRDAYLVASAIGLYAIGAAIGGFVADACRARRRTQRAKHTDRWRPRTEPPQHRRGPDR